MHYDSSEILRHVGNGMDKANRYMRSVWNVEPAELETFLGEREAQAQRNRQGRKASNGIREICGRKTETGGRSRAKQRRSTLVQLERQLAEAERELKDGDRPEGVTTRGALSDASATGDDDSEVHEDASDEVEPNESDEEAAAAVHNALQDIVGAKTLGQILSGFAYTAHDAASSARAGFDVGRTESTVDDKADALRRAKAAHRADYVRGLAKTRARLHDLTRIVEESDFGGRNQNKTDDAGATKNSGTAAGCRRSGNTLSDAGGYGHADLAANMQPALRRLDDATTSEERRDATLAFIGSLRGHVKQTLRRHSVSVSQTDAHSKKDGDEKGNVRNLENILEGGLRDVARALGGLARSKNGEGTLRRLSGGADGGSVSYSRDFDLASGGLGLESRTSAIGTLRLPHELGEDTGQDRAAPSREGRISGLTSGRTGKGLTQTGHGASRNIGDVQKNVSLFFAKTARHPGRASRCRPRLSGIGEQEAGRDLCVRTAPGTTRRATKISRGGRDEKPATLPIWRRPGQASDAVMHETHAPRWMGGAPAFPEWRETRAAPGVPAARIFPAPVPRLPPPEACDAEPNASGRTMGTELYPAGSARPRVREAAPRGAGALVHRQRLLSACSDTAIVCCDRWRHAMALSAGIRRRALHMMRSRLAEAPYILRRDSVAPGPYGTQTIW